MDLYHIKQFWKKNWIIDILLFTIIIVSVFLTYKTKGNWESIDYNGFFLNLTTELLGVWLSVRLIDRLLKKREQLQNARKQLINNVRYPFNYAYRLYPRYSSKDVDHLSNEMKWWERRWINRRRFLKNRECEIILDINRKNYELIHNIENLVIFEDNSDKWNEIIEVEKDKEIGHRKLMIDNTLKDLDASIEKLLLLFWETDNPDKI